MSAPARISRASDRPPLPAQALFAWAGLLALTVVILFAVLVRSPRSIAALEEAAIGPEADTPTAASAVAAEPAAALLAPTAEIDAARRAGVAAMEALSDKYPRDPAVLEALLLLQAVERPRFAATVETARRLFALSPESAGDDAVRRVFVRLCSGPNEIIEAVFAMIDTAAGSAGPDLLYEIVSTDSPVNKPVRDRAQKLLDGAEMKKRASPALLIALDLKAAGPCARKALFARAAESGDARALPSLKPLVSTFGCKRMFRASDCYACLGPRTDLVAAIAAIEGRDTDKR